MRAYRMVTSLNETSIRRRIAMSMREKVMRRYHRSRHAVCMPLRLLAD